MVAPPLDVDGIPIYEVGHESVKSVVPLSILQSLYLASPFLLDSVPSGHAATASSSSNASAINTPPSSRFLTRSQSTWGVETAAVTHSLTPSTTTNHSRRSSSANNSAQNQKTKTIFYTPANSFPPVRYLPQSERKRILVSGGAGFVGSHLVDRLMLMGHDVTVLDNFFSGTKTAVSHWVGHPNFELVRHDVVDPFMIEVDQIYHLACPASPRAYQYNAVKTMKTNFMGTMNMLGLAKRVKARFLLSSTSEVYGSPEEHPQSETYWGHVNPIGPRACYDEGKRVAEALTYGYQRQDGVDVRVARIFNTFGPRMSSNDGRVVSNFIIQALKGEDLVVYGDGKQSRSLQHVHDLIDGLILLMNSNEPGSAETPTNLGTEAEATILDWATFIIETVDEVLLEAGVDISSRKRSSIIFAPKIVDDPPQRRADTQKAKRELGWQPQWTVKEGVKETTRYFLGLQREEGLWQ